MQKRLLTHSLHPMLRQMAISTAVVSGIFGFCLGRFLPPTASVALPWGTSMQRLLFSQAARTQSNTANANDTDSTSDADFSDNVSDHSASREEFKLVLVVRSDLGMTKGTSVAIDYVALRVLAWPSTLKSILTLGVLGTGKIAAQCSHATLACYKTLARAKFGPKILRKWEKHGQTKVAVQVKNGDDLDFLHAQAMSLGLCAQIIHDAGRTQIPSGSATVLGVGPGPKSLVDRVTGNLKLL